MTASKSINHVMIYDRLARVEEKLDHLISGTASQLEDHEGRLRNVETRQSHLLGMGALAAFIAGIVGAGAELPF